MSHMNKKAAVFISGIGNDICSPFFDDTGKLNIVYQNSGSIKMINSVGNTQNVCNTNGHPSGACFGADGAYFTLNNSTNFCFLTAISILGVLYVADFGHAAILAVRSDGQQELVVGVYEDKPLKGPNSIYISNGDIFFTDSGTFGETGLHSATGSLFTISNSPSGQILKPISLGNLAYPSGIAVSFDGKFM